MPSCKLLQCLGAVNTLIAKGCSENGPAMHFGKQVFQSEIFRKYLSYEVQVFV